MDSIEPQGKGGPTGGSGPLGQVVDALTAVPIFVTSPLYRRWHLHWGATSAEAAAPMPGDDLVPVSHFTPTRAVSIAAPPEAVWPWIAQVGFGRAGFYSYDLLDNLGRPSADAVLPEWQEVRVGDLIAPMKNPPTVDTSFRVHAVDEPRWIVWSKPDSTWVWTLTPQPDGGTRLVTRIRQRYARRPATAVTILLSEFGDFAMMRKMLLGIKRRAERHSTQGLEGGRGAA